MEAASKAWCIGRMMSSTHWTRWSEKTFGSETPRHSCPKKTRHRRQTWTTTWQLCTTTPESKGRQCFPTSWASTGTGVTWRSWPAWWASWRCFCGTDCQILCLNVSTFKTFILKELWKKLLKSPKWYLNSLRVIMNASLWELTLIFLRQSNLTWIYLAQFISILQSCTILQQTNLILVKNVWLEMSSCKTLAKFDQLFSRKSHLIL